MKKIGECITISLTIIIAVFIGYLSYNTYQKHQMIEAQIHQTGCEYLGNIYSFHSLTKVRMYDCSGEIVFKRGSIKLD